VLDLVGGETGLGVLPALRDGGVFIVVPSLTGTAAANEPLLNDWVLIFAGVDPEAINVKPTTHGFRFWVASEIAPNIGIDMTTSAEAIPFTVA